MLQREVGNLEERKYYTPFIMRFGLLASWPRTIMVFVAYWVVLLATSFMSGVIQIAILDTWVYVLLLFTILGIWTVNETVKGFDRIFDIFDPEFEAKVKLFKSMDIPKTEEQDRVRSLFSDSESYYKFQDEVRSLVFSRWEHVLVGLVLLAGIVGGVYVFTVYDIRVFGIYGVVLEPYTTIFYVASVAIFIVTGLSAISLLWLLISMVLSVSKIKKHKEDLKINNYIDMINRQKMYNENEVSGYETFYSLTSPIGQFLYGITFRIMMILIGIVTCWMILMTLLGLEIEMIGITLSVALAGASLVIFVIPQMGIHLLLAEIKNEVVDALILRRDETNTKFLLQFTEFTSGDVGSRETPPFGLKALVEHMERIINMVQDQPTWSYRMPTALKLIATSFLPFLIAVLDYLLNQLQLPIIP